MATTSRTVAPLDGGTAAGRAAPGAQRAGRRRVRRAPVSGGVRGALWLIAPLAIFMLVFFVMPIASLLSRSAWDPVVMHAFPATADALAGWRGDTVPAAPATLAALARDIETADAACTLGDAAARLNQDAPGMRALLMRTRRQLSGANPADARPNLLYIDSRWGDLATWKTLSRSLSPLTASYLLRAVDHTETPDGRVVALGQGEGVYLGVLGRTIG
jgi:putative spermidine/putrescine transport system permease protein